MEVYLLSLASLQKEEIQQKVVDLLSETDRIGIEEIKSQKKRLTFLGGRILLNMLPICMDRYLSSSLWKKRQALLF